VEGTVIRGEQRGRKLGFPTANLRPRLSPIVPNGVYAVRVDHEDERYDGVANVGTNPTFGPGRDRTLEAHVFDFSKDVYGKRLCVSFVERLRGELKFASVADLVEQIRRDAERAREVLAL
jgi:riboflavin kinase/FMN adenylyltransferase